jgi:hypothetical protein
MPGRRAAANLMTKEEARRIAANIAPGVLGKDDQPAVGEDPNR